MSRIVVIQEQLQRADNLIAALERVAAERPKPSVLANIRALERERKKLLMEFDHFAAQTKLDICRYRVMNNGPATIDGLTDVWRRFESLLTVVYQSLMGTLPAPPTVKTQKGRKKKGSSGDQLPEPTPPAPLRLGFGYTFPGSVGLALTLPNNTNLFSDEVIVRAADAIFELANAYGDAEKIQHLVRQLGIVPAEKMYQWVDSHIAHRYGVGIEWQRDGQIKAGMLLQYEQLNALHSELSKSTIETRLDVTGVLDGVLYSARQFRIISELGEQYYGSFEEAITEAQAARVPSRCKAIIRATKKVIPNEAEDDKVEYYLASLEDL